MFGRLKKIAKISKIENILDATNSDDKNDFRPGKKAKTEFGVRSPLEEEDITKKEIRYLSRRLNLTSWDKPQMACLASRMQYGTKITSGRLRRVEKAEDILRKKFGIKGNIRVRDYVNSARIEVDKQYLPLLVNMDGFVSKLKQLGYNNVSVDLEGYRTGSMNTLR